jgi:hypothetical protein
LITVRVLDVAAVALAVALGSALVVWWARPETLFLILLGVVSVRLLIDPIAPPSLDPRRVVAGGIVAYAHLSLRSRVFVFPVEIDTADYVLLNTASYPWRRLPGIALECRGSAAVIAMPDGRERRYAVVAEAGPHLLLRSQSSGDR